LPLVSDKLKKIPLKSNISINKIVFDEGKRESIYLRTLGNIVMLVPPLAINSKEINFLIDRAIKTIKNISRQIS